MRSHGVGGCTGLAREVFVSSGRAGSVDARLKRGFRRLLAQLAEGAAIVEDGAGGFQLTSAPKTGSIGTCVSRQMVQACRAADLLRQDGDRLILTDAGHALARRNEADGNEPFRAQHQCRTHGLREVDGLRRTVLLNEGESPLGWLRSRKDRRGKPLIGEAEFEAGERLRADYWFAHMSPRVTANWSASAPLDRSRRGAPANGAALRDDVLAAKDRVMKALAAVGPEVSGVLVDICCELKGLEEAEKMNGWPQRAGKVVLQIALKRLAKHYGLIAGERDRRRELRHWGETDYRPRVDGVPEDPSTP